MKDSAGPSVDYAVRPLDEAVRAAYRRLLPEQADVVAQGKLDWKFTRHPAAAGAVAVASADGDADAIVGMVGFAPARLKLGRERVIAFQAMDTVVDPAFRGRGLFTGLGRAFYGAAPGLGGAAVYGFPNDNAAPGWFEKLEWTRLAPPPFLFKPLRAGYFARRLIGAAGGLLDLPLSLARRPRGAGIEAIERFDASADALWEAFARDIPCAVDRRADFLNWRLFDHPSAAYDVFGVRDAEGALLAFLATHTADKHGGRIGYVMEAMGPDRLLAPLLSEAAWRMRRDRVDAILAWAAPHAPNHGAYRHAGFLPLPERLRPIRLHFGVRPTPPGRPGLAGPRDWYLSYLDSDTV